MSSRPWPAPVRYAMQAVAYGLFAAVLGYFSTAPAYRLRADNEAVIKLSFSHSAQRVQPCRQRTPQELSALAPNMRTQLDCPRERSVIVVELDMDGRPLYRFDLQPTGLHRDGAATLYRRLEIPAGRHTFGARLADGPDRAFNHSRNVDIELIPGQVLIIDFSGAGGGFQFTTG